MDIAKLAEAGLVDTRAFAERATEAMDCYISAGTFVKINIEEALEIIQEAECNIHRMPESKRADDDTQP